MPAAPALEKAESIWVRRVSDPIEFEVRKDSELARRLLEPDYDGVFQWVEIDGPGGDPVADPGDDPLPDPEQVPFDEWRRDQLHRYVTETLGVDPVERFGEGWHRTDLLELIVEREKEARDLAEARAGAGKPPEPDDEYEDMSVADLLALCEERGIEAQPTTPEATLVKRLRVYDARR